MYTFFLFIYRIGHYFGIIFYDGPVFIDRSWFNGFTSVADKYAAGALGFVPKKTFHDAYASNVTDLRFGFVDKVRLCFAKPDVYITLLVHNL